MKKLLPFLICLFILLGRNVQSQTVYITKTGEKYHSEDCRYLRKSSYAIKLSDAKAKGYTPCSVCNPPQSVCNTPTPVTSSPSSGSTTTSSSSSSHSVQCSASTKAGSRCKRMTTSSNGKCSVHGGN
jgi:hypothetical protein